MAHIASLLSLGSLGAVTVVAWNVVAMPDAVERPIALAQNVMLASPATGTAQLRGIAATDVDRTHKTDRLALPRNSDQARRPVASVEIGKAQAIVFRDRAGAVLFGTDPAVGLTTITKNAALPQITLPGERIVPPDARSIKIDEPARAARPSPAGAQGKPQQAKRPVGCDPVVSPIAAPQLGHIIGRCIASRIDVRLASTE